jgi:hypothetical protein
MDKLDKPLESLMTDSGGRGRGAKGKRGGRGGGRGGRGRGAGRGGGRGAASSKKEHECVSDPDPGSSPRHMYECPDQSVSC